MTDAAEADSPAGGKLSGEGSVVVIIVNYRTPDLTRECLSALRGERAELAHLRAMVVDGGSGDGSAERLADLVAQAEFRDWASFLPLHTNGGFGWANNQAILSLAAHADVPEFIHLLNPDACVRPGAIGALAHDLRDNPRAAAAGSQLFSADGAAVPSAFRFPSPGREFVGASGSAKVGKLLRIAPTVISSQEQLDVDWVTGASVMLRTAALKESGLFDDGFFLYFDEVELMHRLHEFGWSVRHVPASEVVHAEGASTGLGPSGRLSSLPEYWYNSRRRYFALTGGLPSVVASNLALILGRSINSLRRLSRSPMTTGVATASGLLRTGFWATRADLRRSAPLLGDEPGKKPFWMSSE